MANFGFTFNMQPARATDVARREVTATVNGGDPPTSRTYDGQPTVTDEFIFADGDQVSIVLVDIDGAGNRSQPSAAFVFTVTDDVPPPAPDGLSVNTKRQID